MTNTRSIIALIAFLMTFSGVKGFAAAPTDMGAMGGGVPSPFDGANRKVELADGETYLLVGRVVFGEVNDESRPYFQVDLESAPWLANKSRRNFPFYALEGSAESWRKYSGLWIKLPARAVSRITSVEGTHIQNISLRCLVKMDRIRILRDR